MSATLEAPPRARPRKRQYTGEDLLSHPEWGPCELIRGKVISVCRPNYTHGSLTSEASGRLREFVKPRGIGDVITGDSGIYLERGPDTVKGPDIYFISAARRPAKESRDGYLEVAPELCIEIVSPREPLDAKTQRKVEQFLAVGVKLIWLIDPKQLRPGAHVLPRATELFSRARKPRRWCFRASRCCPVLNCRSRNCSRCWIDAQVLQLDLTMKAFHPLKFKQELRHKHVKRDSRSRPRTDTSNCWTKSTFRMERHFDHTAG